MIVPLELYTVFLHVILHRSVGSSAGASYGSRAIDVGNAAARAETVAAAALALSSKYPLPEQATLQHERSELFQDLLLQLDPDYRVAVILRYWYDYSYAEIAETMDTTESAIKSRLFRARKSLAEIIGDRDDDDGLTNLQLKGN